MEIADHSCVFLKFPVDRHTDYAVDCERGGRFATFLEFLDDWRRIVA